MERHSNDNWSSQKKRRVKHTLLTCLQYSVSWSCYVYITKHQTPNHWIRLWQHSPAQSVVLHVQPLVWHEVGSTLMTAPRDPAAYPSCYGHCSGALQPPCQDFPNHIYQGGLGKWLIVLFWLPSGWSSHARATLRCQVLIILLLIHTVAS